MRFIRSIIDSLLSGRQAGILMLYILLGLYAFAGGADEESR